MLYIPFLLLAASGAILFIALLTVLALITVIGGEGGMC